MLSGTMRVTHYRLAKIAVTALTLSLAACGGGSSGGSSSDGAPASGQNNDQPNKAATELLLFPASATIQTNELAGFTAYTLDDNEMPVSWSKEGCGWVDQGTGQFHAPANQSGRKSCIATLTATSLDDPNLQAVAQVEVRFAAPEPEAVTTPVLPVSGFVPPKVPVAPPARKIPKPAPPKANPAPITPQPATPQPSPITNKPITTSPAPVASRPKPSTPIKRNTPENPTTDPNTSLVTYPAVPGYKSSRFSIRLIQNTVEKNSFVYQSNNNSKPAWNGTLNYMQKANHWTTFSFSGSVKVETSRNDGKAIQSCIVRPLSLNIQAVIQGNRCQFTLNKPAQVSVEIDETKMISENFKHVGKITKQIVKHALLVFANPLEKNIPQASDANVLYFGPGIHQIGKQYKLANNIQVYIAGGAYVIGTFRSASANPKNITIRGRGILSADKLPEGKNENNQWRNHSIDFSQGLRGSNLLVEGITITDPLRSCIISYSTITLRNIKLFSWRHRSDGITAGNRSVIEDSFIKVQDDNIKLYYSNQKIQRNVIWQQTAGAVFKFAWSLGAVSRGNRIQDIDIIRSDVFNDYSGQEKDRPELRSSSAIFSAMGFEHNAAFKDAAFKNIRIDEKYLYRLLGLRMVTSHKNEFWGNPHPNASKTIEDIRFENIRLASVPFKASTLYGNKGGTIRNIRISGLRINGSLIGSKNLLTSKIDGSGLLTAGSVANISFSN
ncbi:MAG: hypothetical protein V3W04_14240 [Gammaproteobacteria bacterium]